MSTDNYTEKTETSETETPKENTPEITRRKFLEYLGLAAVGLVASAAGIIKTNQPEPTQQPTIEPSPTIPPTQEPTPEPTPIPEIICTPEIVKGVPVYGLKEKIHDIKEIESLYRSFDKEYEEKNNFKIVDKYKQKTEVLDPKERYLELVVFKSAYETFTRREKETGVDFVEWINMHVDAMNLCFSEAKPTSELKAVLRRVVVVEDNALDSIFNMKEYFEGKAPFGPDFPYLHHFVGQQKTPFDTDESWVVASDYRPESSSKDYSKFGKFWSCDSEDGKICFGDPPGAEEKKHTYTYTDKGSHLTGKKRVWMDFGMTHEWLHYLFNLPDEYGYDLQIDGKHKTIIETGSFCEPNLSTYLSVLSQNQIEKKLRNPILEGCGVGYSILEIPENLEIKINGDAEISNVKFLRTRDNSQKYFLEMGDLFPKSKSFKASKETLIKNKAYYFSLGLNIDGEEKELYMPYLGFNMSKILGETNPSYEIEILDKNIKNGKLQYIKILDQKDVDAILNADRFRRAIAKMKIEGSDAYYVWFQSK